GACPIPVKQARRNNVRAKVLRWALLAVVVARLQTGCTAGSDGESNDDEDPSGATLAVNPLAEAYPQGLSMSALSEQNSGAEGYSSGSLAVDESDASNLTDNEMVALADTPASLLGYSRLECEAYQKGL